MMENLINGLCLGLGVWFFTWGMNRVYLMWKDFFKGLIS